MKKPFYKASHQAWYANIHGKQVKLDKDEAEALISYGELLKGERSALTLK
jgi:hypothetical protein